MKRNINNLISEAILPLNKSDDTLFPKKQLKMGIETEKEHTNNPDIAKSIAKDHLGEIPDYYTRLKKMEKQGKKDIEGK